MEICQKDPKWPFFYPLPGTKIQELLSFTVSLKRIREDYPNLDERTLIYKLKVPLRF